MKYGIIVTQQPHELDLDAWDWENRFKRPIHWLKRGTLVKYISETRVKTLCPVFGVDAAGFAWISREQFINPQDVRTLPAFLGPVLKVAAGAYWRAAEFWRAGAWQI